MPQKIEDIYTKDYSINGFKTILSNSLTIENLNKLKKNIIIILFFNFLFTNLSLASVPNKDFLSWLSSFKKSSIKRGISEETVDKVFQNVKFLEKVIIYDRKQPEFYEDTITYVSKRANIFRAKKARKLLKENKKLFDDVEKEFSVEKEILL